LFIDIVSLRILPLMVIGYKSNFLARVLIISSLFFSSFLYAEDSEQKNEQTQSIDFEVSPNRCVTLRQGQPCFVRVQFNWRSKKALSACLYNLDGTKIACWKSSETGSIVLTQTLPTTTEYILADADGMELDRTSIAVSWVYRKKRSKRRWRLF